MQKRDYLFVASPAPKELVVTITDKGDFRPWEDIEREIFERAIAIYGQNMSHLSRTLKIARSTLYRWQEKFSNKPA